MIDCAGACRCRKFGLRAFSMANTAIASNRAVPGNIMALEYKYATQFFKLFLWIQCQAFEHIELGRKIITPFVFIYFFFFFYPWTALLCYDCISYEGSVSDTGSGPHGRKDSTTKSRTGTFRDGVGEGVFCLSFFVVSIIDFDLDLLERDGVHLQIKDSSYWHALVTCCSQRFDVCRLSSIDSHKSCDSKVFTIYWKKKVVSFRFFGKLPDSTICIS